ncbi:MAG: hypothetical protein HN919_20830 [Verrucomicrobia bacterium]|jgi:4-amino-4-deoxy-L-arabinose transferase-like glycosyltransferase|nr:hypothetical protein [Verrucomicrobiota bacterium]MBT7068752.1 hypothetical protein [Verrucomicrobiota bacterium]MBT7698879.1 hypothetical protein [Verrucomicrobiota bacterium]
MSTSSIYRRRIILFYATLCLVLAAGVLVRVMGAWWLGLTADPDHTAAAVMARHMVQGTAFPLFHYGRPLMGSFEPALSGLFYRVLGDSSWATNLGAACLGALLLPVVFAWGRSAGGPRAGLAATLYTVVGPPLFFRHSSCTYGGDAALMLCATSILWLTTYMADHTRTGRRFSRWLFLCLGLAAGIGWWTSPLVLGFYVAALLIWVVALRGRCLTWRLIYVGVGFMLTSAPWWWSRFAGGAAGHARDGWAAATIGPGSGPLPLATLLDLVGLWRERPARLTGGLTVLLLVILALAVMVRRWRGVGRRGNALYILAALMGATAHMALSFGLPHDQALSVRALLPLVPLLAVFLGVATAGLGRHLAWGVGWLPLLFLIAPHLAALRDYPKQHARDAALRHRAVALQAELEASGIAGVYVDHTGPVGGYALGLMTDEAICFSDPAREGCHAYRLRMASLSQIAVLGDYGRIGSLVASTRATARQRELHGFVLHDQLMPPPAQREIPPDQWRVVPGQDGGTADPALADASLSTRMTCDQTATGFADLTIAFSNSVTVSGFRLHADPAAYPAAWELQLPDDRGKWRTVAGPYPRSPCFWSGPRPYYGSPGYRLEGQCEAVSTTRVRLRLHRAPAQPAVSIAQLQWFGPAGPATHDVDSLLAVLRQREVRHVYADRWLAKQLARLAGERIEATSEMSMLQLHAWSGLVVRREDARLSRAALERTGISMRETRVGAWVLFDIPPGAWKHSYACCANLRWVGYGCLVQ